MNFTGLSEFLWFLLLFGAMFAFTVWRQQRDRRRREERMGAMSAPQFEPEPVAAPAPVEAGPAPDISWGRGPAVPVPPPEIPPNWREAPARPEAAALPPRTPPVATRAPRRPAPAVRPPAVAGRVPAPLRSDAGLRQAVIAMTVLGPCRALEPYGGQWPQQEPGGGGRARRPRPEGP